MPFIPLVGSLFTARPGITKRNFADNLSLGRIPVDCGWSSIGVNISYYSLV